MLGLTGVLAYARRHTKVRAAPKVTADAAPPAPLLLRVLLLRASVAQTRVLM
jgi:hypothetical protein